MERANSDNNACVIESYVLIIKGPYYGVPFLKVFYVQMWILYVICQYSFMLHPKMYGPCPNPSTICEFLHVMCLLMCHMLYPFTYAICFDPCIMCLKTHVAWGNSLITWAKIALSLSLFVVSSPVTNFMWANSFVHDQIFTWHGLIHLLTLGDCYHLVIIKHDFSLQSNFDKLPFM